eukprot:183140-Amphidinium_carterae.1
MFDLAPEDRILAPRFFAKLVPSGKNLRDKRTGSSGRMQSYFVLAQVDFVGPHGAYLSAELTPASVLVSLFGRIL